MLRLYIITNLYFNAHVQDDSWFRNEKNSKQDMDKKKRPLMVVMEISSTSVYHINSSLREDHVLKKTDIEKRACWRGQVVNDP